MVRSSARHDSAAWRAVTQSSDVAAIRMWAEKKGTIRQRTVALRLGECECIEGYGNRRRSGGSILKQQLSSSRTSFYFSHQSIAPVRNSKFQHPTSREAPIFKFQNHSRVQKTRCSLELGLCVMMLRSVCSRRRQSAPIFAERQSAPTDVGGYKA